MYDSTLSLLAQGYAWLPSRRRLSGGAPMRTRLFGKRAIALHGPDAVRFFYDEGNVRRKSALPGPVLDTLFGRGAVHTLDGEQHRVRKALFVALLTDEKAVAGLAERVAEEWSRAGGAWGRRPQVVLFDEVSFLITRAVCAWAGIPLTPEETEEMAKDLVAMVDGFGTPGPRRVRARRARARQEERLAALVEDVRRKGTARDAATATWPGASAVEIVAAHRDADGTALHPKTAAVELLNIIRPTVAVTWFIVFAAHALHRHPRLRAALAADDPDYAWAFAQEARRFYPFVPFIAGVAARDLEWHGEPVPEGTLLLLDVYGQNHDPGLWPQPYTFDPERFTGPDGAPGPDDLIPQGGGDVATGHRCPGEDIALALLETLAPRLARMDYEMVPDQDLRIPLHRLPTRPRSGVLIRVGG